MFRAEVFVTLKPTVNDPAGLTIRGGLHTLGFQSVKDVRAGKYLVLTLDESDEDRARARVEEMAHQLLANPVIEEYRIELHQESPSPLAGEAQAKSPSPLAGEAQAKSPSPVAGDAQAKSPSPLAGEGWGGGSTTVVAGKQPA